VTYPVRYSDLDVSAVKGARTLYLRIRYAAETHRGEAQRSD